MRAPDVPSDKLEEARSIRTAWRTRSLHLVFRHANTRHPESNGLRVELQIRPLLQHAWATAVETLGAVERASFKTGERNETAWRFFQVASALFALDEGQPPVVASCEGRRPKELVREFDYLDACLAATVKLKALSARCLPGIRNTKRKGGMLLLVLQVMQNGESCLQIQRFDQWKMAEMTYSGIELLTRDDPSVSVLLMTTDNVSRLRQAYPNYYLDASLFLENIQRICDKFR